MPTTPKVRSYTDTFSLWTGITHNPNYVLASPEYQDKIKAKFQQDFKYGKGAVNQTEGASRGILSNLAHIGAHSVQNTLDMSHFTDDVWTGEIDPGTYKRMEGISTSNINQYTPPELKRIYASMQQITHNYDKAKGVAETLSAIGSNLADTVSLIGSNPSGVLEMAMDSAGTMIPTMVGMGIGGLAGGKIGAAGGQWVGEVISESGARLYEEAQKELQHRGLPPTADNFKIIFSNQKFKTSALKKAKLKAVGTATADTAFSILAGKILSAPARNAERAALKSLVTGASQDAKDVAIRNAVQSISKGTKLKAFLKAGFIEQLSEPSSELAGAKLAGDKTQTGELASEWLGGFGSSIIHAAVDKVAYTTKLTGAAAITIPKVTKEAFVNARNTANYKTKVKEASKQNVNLAEYKDRSNPDKYSPLFVVDVLATNNNKKETTPEQEVSNFVEATQVQEDLQDHYDNTMEKITVLSENADRGIKGEDELKQLLHNSLELGETLDAVNATVSQMAPREATEANLTKNVEEAVEGHNSGKLKQAVYNIIGSKSSGSDINTHLDFEKILQDETLDNSTKSLVSALQTQEEARTEIDNAVTKNTDEVSHDIFRGIGQFKGIDFYNQSIVTHLKNGDVKQAKKQLKRLVTFTKSRVIKQQLFTKMQKFALGELNEAEIPAYEAELAAENRGRQLRGYAPLEASTPAQARGLHGIINNMQREVAALNAAINVGSQLFESNDLEHNLDLTTSESQNTPNTDTFTSTDTTTQIDAQTQENPQGFSQEVVEPVTTSTTEQTTPESDPEIQDTSTTEPVAKDLSQQDIKTINTLETTLRKGNVDPLAIQQIVRNVGHKVDWTAYGIKDSHILQYANMYADHIYGKEAAVAKTNRQSIVQGKDALHKMSFAKQQATQINIKADRAGLKEQGVNVNTLHNILDSVRGVLDISGLNFDGSNALKAAVVKYIKTYNQEQHGTLKNNIYAKNSKQAIKQLNLFLKNPQAKLKAGKPTANQDTQQNTQHILKETTTNEQTQENQPTQESQEEASQESQEELAAIKKDTQDILSDPLDKEIEFTLQGEKQKFNAKEKMQELQDIAEKLKKLIDCIKK